MKRDKRLRDGLVSALIREELELSPKLAGEILERWDELVDKEELLEGTQALLQRYAQDVATVSTANAALEQQLQQAEANYLDYGIRIQAFASRVVRAEEALRRYAVHDVGCEAHNDNPCTCGLDEALSASGATPRSEEDRDASG